MIIYSLLFAMQAAPQAPLDTTPAPWPDQERELRTAGAFQADSSPEARLMTARVAECVIESSPKKVADVLTRDFRTSTYRSALRNLTRANDGCGRKAGLRGRLYLEGLPFAAALAEAMLEKDPAPLNARLAKAAAGPAAPTYSPTDSVAMCVARSVPDDVAALFASVPGSAGEMAVMGKVETAAKICARGIKMEISPFGLRSIVATASYRLVAKQGV
jgi:hypothetical protein